MATKKVFIYKRYERFWHWTQAFLVILLAITGFEIHGSYTFMGYENAVDLHNKSAWALIILMAFTIFWHFTTGEWRQYIPTTKNLKAQIDYYLTGIFKNAPHPVRKTVISKLNPLQRIVYFLLKVLAFPVMVITGLTYMFYRYQWQGEIRELGIENIDIIAIIHTVGAYLLIAFIVVHLYLITTGHTITSNLKAMITGWEELEEEETQDKVTDKKEKAAKN